MRLQPSKAADSALLTTILLPALVAAVGNLDCQRIVTGDKTWDLSALTGPHSVMTSHEQPPSIVNTTFTIDICQNLEKKGDVKKDDACPSYTRGKFLKKESTGNERELTGSFHSLRNSTHHQA